MRIELRDGQWADLRERITHGQDKVLKKALAAAKGNDAAAIDFDTIVVGIFLRDWYVKDPDGNPIPATDADAVERAPEDIVDLLVDKGVELYTGATVPKENTPPLSADT